MTTPNADEHEEKPGHSHKTGGNVVIQPDWGRAWAAVYRTEHVLTWVHPLRFEGYFLLQHFITKPH